MRARRTQATREPRRPQASRAALDLAGADVQALLHAAPEPACLHGPLVRDAGGAELVLAVAAATERDLHGDGRAGSRAAAGELAERHPSRLLGRDGLRRP